MDTNTQGMMARRIGRLKEVESVLEAEHLTRSHSVREAGYVVSMVVDGCIYITYRGGGGTGRDIPEETQRLTALADILKRDGIHAMRRMQMGVAQLVIW